MKKSFECDICGAKVPYADGKPMTYCLQCGAPQYEVDSQEQKETEEDRNKFGIWVKKHKKQLIAVGVSIPTVIAVAVGIKRKDSFKEWWETLCDRITDKTPYSDKWFQKATDQELDIARESVRLKYCNPAFHDSPIDYQKLLRRFDSEMSKRAWKGEIPTAPAFHREHGWYIMDKD